MCFDQGMKVGLAILPIQFKRLRGVRDIEDSFSIPMRNLDAIINILVRMSTHGIQRGKYEDLPSEGQT